MNKNLSLKECIKDNHIEKIHENKDFSYSSRIKINKRSINLPKKEGIYYNETPYILELIFIKNNKIHNSKGPAIIFNSKLSNFSEILFYKNGIRHRNKKPAYIKYNGHLFFNENKLLIKNKKISHIVFYEKGEIHNLFGPSEKILSPFYLENWYYKDKILPKKVFFNNKDIIRDKNKVEMREKMRKEFKL